MIQIEQIGEITKFRLARTISHRGLYFTSAYWIDGLMIDTGCAYTVHELIESLGNLPVRCIVNTHCHEDHIAGNAALQAKFGIEVLAHPEALPILADPRKKRLRPYQLVMWGYPAPSHGKAIGDVVETERHRFEVIHTPGHSIDHICLYEAREGWLFTGDAYVGGRDRALRLDYNVWQIVESLKRLASLDVKILFPGSGTTRDAPHEELLRKIEYLEETGDRVLNLHGQGWSRRRIRRRLFGREMAIAYYTLGHFSGRNLVRSYIEDRAVDSSHTNVRSKE
jgi:glyoxylase-like metal-dependent hydrolase (beta-lactamase superfamily II)